MAAVLCFGASLALTRRREGGMPGKEFTAKALKLDYFKIYDCANHMIGDFVSLEGQFDKEAQPARVHHLEAFANVATKNGEPLFDTPARLTWYAIFDPVPEPTRRVVVRNQFGDQELTIGPAKDLLVPARTYEPGSGLSPQLDHFKLYRVLGGPVLDRTVVLKDALRSERVVVTVPFAFGVPVAKTHAGKTTPIKNKAAHLVIYRITPRPINKTIRVLDQFSGHWIITARSMFVAAPSVKKSWEPV
jgi:hypothetical protein